MDQSVFALERPCIWVQRVENILFEGNVVGARVVSNVDSKIVTDWILAQDRQDATYENAKVGLSFTGRFAIVRTNASDDVSEVELYIGDGEQLSFAGHELSGGDDRKGYKAVDSSIPHQP